MSLWVSNISVTALAYCAEDPRFETLRAKGWTLAHCLPSEEWGRGGNTGEIKPMAQDKCHLQQALRQHTDRMWDSPFRMSLRCLPQLHYITR